VLVLAFVVPSVNGAAVLGVTEPLRVVKSELMDSDGPVVREFGPGRVVVPLPTVPLEPVSDTGELVLLDPGPPGRGVPEVEVGMMGDKVVGVRVLLP
jgi:hypothetical protein